MFFHVEPPCTPLCQCVRLTYYYYCTCKYLYYIYIGCSILAHRLTQPRIGLCHEINTNSRIRPVTTSKHSHIGVFYFDTA